ncbi:MAG: helix-turn-helix domain-containing protein [Gammaproteobacteria bacterium]
MTAENTITFRDRLVIDANDQAAIQDWMPLQITQLSAGSYEGRVRIIDHQDVSVFFESQNCTVHKRGVTSQGLCTLSFFREQNVQHRFSTHNSEDHSLFFLPGGTDCDIHVRENASTVYFLLSQDALLDRLRVMQPTQWNIDPTDVLALNMIDRRPFHALADLLHSSRSFANNQDVGQQYPQFGKVIVDQLVMTMKTVAGEWQQSGSIKLGRARVVVNRAIDFILEEFRQHRCPTIVDVCLALQISQRTLEYSFQTLLQTTPVAYVRYLRLNQARRQLLRACKETDNVTAIAMHWHFLHLGKFAKDYYLMFGESPSATLRKS